MSSAAKLFSMALALYILNTPQLLQAQDQLSWLEKYSAEISIGSDTYQYGFTNVEGKACKIKIEEQVRDKKGEIETQSWIFYLSDMDPSKLSFKAKGKSLLVSMETHQSQKFISHFEEGEIDGYTHEIGILMSEVEMARTFLEILKQKIGACERSETKWKNRDEAFTWLVNNIGKASEEGLQWDQKFQQGNRSYLVDFKANSENEKGEQKTSNYFFDITDIDSMKMNLRISGKLLFLELPVLEGNRFIRLETPAGTTFTNKMQIHVDNIELARQTFNALSYVLANTSAERPQWDSYSASLGFVKDHLTEVSMGKYLFSNTLNFENSPSGRVELITEKSESGGTPEKTTHAFYLFDMMDQLKFEVSKSGITLEMGTKDKHAFIQESIDEQVTAYSSAMDFHVADIDLARDIISALEYSIKNSEEKIEEFNQVSQTISWFAEHVAAIEIDGNTYQQTLSIDQEKENQMTIKKKEVKSDETSTETMFVLYPEDLSLDKLDIKVSGKKLFVSLVTGSNKYVKNFENNEIQDFRTSTEILFSDPLKAKNCMAAIRFLKAHTPPEDSTVISKEEAMAFLLENIQTIELPAEQYFQTIDAGEEDQCKINFTRVELTNKKTSTENRYEFAASDINPGNSKLSVKKEFVLINLVTNGNEKLIKPYKNGEADDFVDDFFIYVDDVMLAKKTLAAFAALSEGCR